MTPFTLNFVAVTFLKPNTRTMLTSWNWIDHRATRYQSKTIEATPSELRIIKTCNKLGSRSKWAHSKTFCGGITMKMLCQLWRQCKNGWPFTTTKISMCWSLVVIYQTSPTFVYTILFMQKTICIKGARKRTFGENSRRCCWWYIYCFYTENNCWWNFYSKGNKLLQIYS